MGDLSQWKKEPNKQSDIFFDSVTAANRAGKLALKQLSSEYPD
jgi:hypothetical protein